MSGRALGTGRWLDGCIMVIDLWGRLRAIQGWKPREDRLAELGVCPGCLKWASCESPWMGFSVFFQWAFLRVPYLAGRCHGDLPGVPPERSTGVRAPGFHPCNVDERLSRGRFGRVSRATGAPVVSMLLPATGMGGTPWPSMTW